MNFLKALFGRNTASANAAGAEFKAAYDASRITIPPANSGSSTYPISKLTDADKSYLLRMDSAYREAVGGQIFFDILTDEAGRTWMDLGDDKTPAGRAFKLRVNTVINYADRIPHVYQWNPTTYSGPLVAVLGAAAAKHKR